ncbi:PIN domain-containing protein [Candidatus Daviesbacteria bacterium]|nr:PIN domain-containing protein [Candidatus Daviesbacteria bacterium]
MRISEPVLFDTNILIYAQDPKSKFYSQAESLIKQVVDGQLVGVLSQQNLLEFYSVMTDSKRVTNPILPDNCLKLIQDLINSLFLVISPGTDALNVLSDICQKLNLKDGKIFDAYLVATMLSNKIFSILTANTKDFQNFPDIKIFDIMDV